MVSLEIFWNPAVTTVSVYSFVIDHIWTITRKGKIEEYLTTAADIADVVCSVE